MFDRQKPSDIYHLIEKSGGKWLISICEQKNGSTDDLVIFGGRRETMYMSHMPPGPLAALIAGILILIVPRLLNYVVAIYLILIGILGLVHGAWW